MRRRGARRLKASILLGLVIAATVTALPASGEEMPGEDVALRRATLVADNMTGPQVVPGPGDPDGFGTAWIPNNPKAKQICWDIRTERISVPLIGSLIHAGGSGQQGVVALQLFGETNDPTPSGCLTADTELLRSLNRRSREYYIEISNYSYPAGAIRGQLRQEPYVPPVES